MGQHEVTARLGELTNTFIERHHSSSRQRPCIPLNEETRYMLDSPCVEQVDEEAGVFYWTPKPHMDFTLFDGLEQGLEVAIHPSITAFYGSYWSDGLWCSSPFGEVSLIQLWNEEDMETLRENLLGHAFQKSKRRQGLTLFIGLTADDRIVTVDNHSGEVYLEEAGRPPQRTLAASLGELLRELEPTLTPYTA
ncbi:SecY-interacting protein [Hahella sp. HN01]|uniref:SecY-interacting protein n=1 Tax=Hahella sp. HN01 TaxID=2847262 RepID=UPI001C1F042F|nr:SecY-interacting protein [Hahella sp. HN01]MBU6955121.1 SecY-interacting protein [Hahella sp. HN01]